MSAAASFATHARRAERCFALAKSTTHAGERDAAIARGMAIVDKYSLDAADFDIPGRARARPRQTPLGELPITGFMAAIFGECVGCGGVASTGAMCRTCMLRAESRVCSHGRHGFCFDCGDAA